MTSSLSFDLFTTFVQLQANGCALAKNLTADFWQKLGASNGDWVVGAVHGMDPSDFYPDQWEMHPGGEELLYLLAGAVDVILREPGGEKIIKLQGGKACLVPRGIWHRLVLRQVSDLLFVTPPHGTQLRKD